MYYLLVDQSGHKVASDIVTKISKTINKTIGNGEIRKYYRVMLTTTNYQ